MEEFLMAVERHVVASACIGTGLFVLVFIGIVTVDNMYGNYCQTKIASKGTDKEI